MFDTLPSTGVDIGTDSIKCAVVEPKRKSIRCLWQAQIIPSRQVYDEELAGETLHSRLAMLIQSCMRECPECERRVVTAIQGEDTISRYIELPPLSPKELDLAVRSRAVEYVPFPLENMTLSYVSVPPVNPESKSSAVFFVAATKKSVDKLLKELERCGMEVSRIEVPALALVREFAENHQPFPREFIALISLGFKYTHCVVLREGFPYYTRNFPVGGRDFMYGFQTGMHFSWEEAEKYMKNYDVRLREAPIGPFLSRWTSEIKKSIAYFNSQYCPGAQGVSRVFLSGGSSGLKGLEAHLSSILGLPVEKDSWEKLRCASPACANGSAATYKVAVGLALSS